MRSVTVLVGLCGEHAGLLRSTPSMSRKYAFLCAIKGCSGPALTCRELVYRVGPSRSELEEAAATMGSVSSPAKAAASRANGALGGRPKGG